MGQDGARAGVLYTSLEICETDRTFSLIVANIRAYRQTGRLFEFRLDDEDLLVQTSKTRRASCKYVIPLGENTSD